MNNTQNNPNIRAGMDEVDDLTRFLDEDFATDEVDLFEFTSEEDSPLTHLKSIILSLDWEITNETLQDLNDEIAHLKRLDQFAHDKVSQVYLQGLDKIGKYIQSEGAYAHPNSIKLLLTLYYDFEKILSSEHITGAEITALLKADVRKFKILQHQIAQRHGTTATATEEVSVPLPLTEHKDLQGIQAAILELDWEVSDKGLQTLADQLNVLKSRYAGDRYIQVLIQGLHSLNAYIMEEKGRAHPETFSLLHNFYDALETLIEKESLGEEQRQDILIDCVNRLNNLKNLIAQTYPTEDLAPEAITPVPESGEPREEELAIDLQAEAQADQFPAEGIAEEPEAEQLPGEEAEPAPSPEPEGMVQEAAEDMKELEKPEVDRGGEESPEITPALADSTEEAGFGGTGDLEAPPEELEEKLDFFFGGDKEEFVPEAIEKAAAARKAEEQVVEQPPAGEHEEEIAPALAGSVEEKGFDAGEADLETPPAELEEKLASFFEEEAPTAESREPEEPAGAEEEVPAAAAEEEHPFAFELEEEIAPALADSEEDRGFGAPGTAMEPPPDELADRLESFFGGEETPAEEEAPTMPAAEEKVPAAPAEEAEEEPAPALADEDEEEIAAAFADEGDEEIAPALADLAEETGFAAAEAEAAASSQDLEKKLDSFFGDEEEKAGAHEPAEEAQGEEEEVLLTQALEEPERDSASRFGERHRASAMERADEMLSPEEYQAAMEKMKSAFAELENSLRQEISSLRREVEFLRSRLNG